MRSFMLGAEAKRKYIIELFISKIKNESKNEICLGRPYVYKKRAHDKQQVLATDNC